MFIKNIIDNSYQLKDVEVCLMCTGFTFQSYQNETILGRTMDYDWPLTGHPAILPRHYTWESRADYQGTTLYGFVGTGSDMEGFMFGDGMNEHGLAISTQYDRDYCTYASEILDDYINISQNDVLIWVLGYHQTIEELIQHTSKVNVVAVTLNDINDVPPLHYHVSDATGRSAEITFEDGRMVVRDNPIGVLTNHPDLNWHYENLKQYINITPYQPQSQLTNGATLQPLGAESGTHGLPGGYTSTERFVRAAYLTRHLKPSPNDNPILDAFRILDTVSIPKGAVRPEGSDFYYTLYQTVFNLSTKTMYVKYYQSNQILELQLNEDLLNQHDLIIYEPIQGISTTSLN